MLAWNSCNIQCADTKAKEGNVVAGLYRQDEESGRMGGCIMADNVSFTKIGTSKHGTVTKLGIQRTSKHGTVWNQVTLVK